MSELNEILVKITGTDDVLKSANIIEDGFLDSFDLVLLVSEIEQVFDLVIPGEYVTADNFVNILKISEMLVDLRSRQ